MTSTASPQSYDYRYKRSVSELHCYYVVNPESPHGDWTLREVIRPAQRALRADYGITLEPLRYGEIPARHTEGISYLIYGPTNPLTMSADEQAYLAALAATGIKTNIISAYPLTATGADTPDYARARVVVPQLCAALNINAIFPDDLDLERGIRTNNWQDVYVNAIGETIRVKYQPTESFDPDDRALRERLRDEHADDIAALARLHHDHHLWQRTPFTDGSILFTHDGYWYASQTVTDKTLMTSDDFDLISSYDEGLRGITYHGPRLPSSDAPEFLMLSSLLSMHARRPRLIVHFHHRELTRGARYRELVTNDTIEGGHFVAGRRFFQEMRRMSTNWFIIREHGMVWTGDSVAEFEEYVHGVVSAAG